MRTSFLSSSWKRATPSLGERLRTFTPHLPMGGAGAWVVGGAGARPGVSAAAGEGRGHGQERCCVRGMAEHAPQRLPSQQPQPTPRAKPLPPPTLALSSAARALVSLTEALPAWCASSSLAAPATTVRRSCTRAARFLQLVGWWDDDAWDDACLAQHIRETAGAARPSQPRYARPPPHVLRAPDLQHRLPQVLGDVLVVANLPLPQQLGRGVL